MPVPTPYATFTFYTTTYKGTGILESAFPKIILRSSAIIDLITFNRASSVFIGTNTALINSISFATCAIADKLQSKLQSDGKGEITSEKVGDHSISYQFTPESLQSAREQYLDEAEIYLFDTGLLYRGLDED